MDIMAQVGTQLGRVFERKRAELAQAESENRFRGFFEHVPEYCYMLSPEGKILDVNRTALSALKYSKGDLIGKPRFVSRGFTNLAQSNGLVVGAEKSLAGVAKTHWQNKKELRRHMERTLGRYFYEQVGPARPEATRTVRAFLGLEVDLRGPAADGQQHVARQADAAGRRQVIRRPFAQIRNGMGFRRFSMRCRARRMKPASARPRTS